MLKLLLLLIPITVSAGSFITEDHLIRINTGAYPRTVYDDMAKCESLSGKTCYDITGKDGETHIINMFGFVVEDSALINLKNARLQVIKNKLDAIKARKTRLSDSIGNINSMTAAQKDNLLKDLINELLE